MCSFLCYNLYREVYVYADVILELNVFKNKTFTYSIPKDLNIKIGSRVSVPFGNRVINGVVLKINSKLKDHIETKDIIKLIDEYALNEEQVNLIYFMRKTYLCSYLDAYRAMMPPALKLTNSKTKIKIEKKYYISMPKRT